MKPFQLFEATMNIINKYQEEIYKDEEDKHILDVSEIRELLDNDKLPDACDKVHKFISYDLECYCFKNKFPITFAYDQWKMANWKKVDYNPNKKHDCLGYDICFNKNDYKTHQSDESCDKCSFYKGAKANGLNYKNELEHFLIRLLFETAAGLDNAFGNKTKKVNPPKEAGLFILAAEVLLKDASRKIAIDKILEGFFITGNMTINEFKKKIKTELSD